MQFIAIIALSLASLSVTSANILDSLLGGGGGGGGWGEQSPSAVNCNVQTGSLLNREPPVLQRLPRQLSAHRQVDLPSPFGCEDDRRLELFSPGLYTFSIPSFELCLSFILETIIHPRCTLSFASRDPLILTTCNSTTT
ncbi:hypothetical protein PCANC_12937 [Puccinia coronata f. sp. avenae]|uniref:Uncharacterized protein n=1 Tax=Puccinia coronata f. sp. avenae TaxID=200324 RepID=A0A2N5UDG4_9BASI|nr:hypothetical protein PCASD_26480 [Puccinia coronata f. sp. avenae]PLW25376.1 hypothetical protein PCASD_25687 [Puccinia coronata f. sp. avenae]PLW35785.1 hypothetical protein PCASD_15703 [Puccinia coronata f. sp. avenae]PLW39195.1 hypothetical protein PCANC_12937 [Puccinia coronata f. sp. avenae]